MSSRNYEIAMLNYMQILETDPKIYNIKTKQKTLKSVINQFATFLKKRCPLCNIPLVQVVTQQSCGNCGWS